jgi:hypothetical protein
METCTIPFACSTVTMISARGGENFIALDRLTADVSARAVAIALFVL